MKRKLVLENGKSFTGIGFGSNNECIAELIFNTEMVGYQEVLANPVYAKKIVCMSYPLIGNYGLADEDYSDKNVSLSAFVVREYNDIPSNFRSNRSLAEAMEENGVVGISEIDTRALVRILRDNGPMVALICDEDKPLEECLKAIKDYKEPANLVSLVSTKRVWNAKTTNPLYNLVVVDCGVKNNFPRELNKFGANVVVVPYNYKFDAIMKYNPDGIIISDGPGNPMDNLEVVELVKMCKGKLPILGIGLGGLITSLSYDLKVNKMKKCHFGCNFPVRNLQNNKLMITAQSHEYTICKECFDDSLLKITHQNIIDGDIEKCVDVTNKVITTQFINDEVILEFIDFIKLGGATNAKKNRY